MLYFRQLTIILASALLLSVGCAGRGSDWKPSRPANEFSQLDYAYRLFQLAQAQEREKEPDIAVGLYRQAAIHAPINTAGNVLRHYAVTQLVRALHEAYRVDQNVDRLVRATAIMQEYLDPKHRKVWQATATPNQIATFHAYIDILQDEIRYRDQQRSKDKLAKNLRPSSERKIPPLPIRAVSRTTESGRRVIIVQAEAPGDRDSPSRVPRHLRRSNLRPSSTPFSMAQHLSSPKIHVWMGNNAQRSSKQPRFDKRLANKTLVASRDQLRRCFLEAMTRTPWLAATVELEVDITDNQIKYAGVSQGKLIDDLGEECVRSIPPRTLDDNMGRTAQLATLETRFQIPVDFFYSGPKQFPHYRIYGSGQNRYQSSDVGFSPQYARSHFMSAPGPIRPQVWSSGIPPWMIDHDVVPFRVDNTGVSPLFPGGTSHQHYMRHRQMESDYLEYIGLHD